MPCKLIKYQKVPLGTSEIVATDLNPLEWYGETSRVWTGINSSPTIWSSRWLFLVVVLWMIWVVINISEINIILYKSIKYQKVPLGTGEIVATDFNPLKKW